MVVRIEEKVIPNGAQQYRVLCDKSLSNFHKNNIKKLLGM